MTLRTALIVSFLTLGLASCGEDTKETLEDVRDKFMEQLEKACKTVADEFAECANRVNEGEVTAEERKERIDECVFNNESYSEGVVDCLESCEEDLTCEKKMDASNCDCENRCGAACGAE